MYEALKNAIRLNKVEILSLLGAPDVCSLDAIRRRCTEKAFADELSIMLAIDELVSEGAILFEDGVAAKALPVAAKKPKAASLGMG